MESSRKVKLLQCKQVSPDAVMVELPIYSTPVGVYLHSKPVEFYSLIQ